MEQQRFILAFALSMAIIIGYGALFPPPPVEQAENAAQPVSEDLTGVAGTPVQLAQQPNAAAVAAAEAKLGATRAAERTETIETDLYSIDFSSHGGRISRLYLKDYKADNVDEGQLDMIDVVSRVPLGLYWLSGDDASSVKSDTPLEYDIAVAESGDDVTVTMRASTPDGVTVTKQVTAHSGSYVLDFSANVSDPAVRSLGVAWARRIDENAGRASGVEGPFAFVDGSLEYEYGNSIAEPEQYVGETHWAGYADHYFLAAFFPEEPSPLRMTASASKGDAQATVWSDAGSSVSYGLFVGPKSIELLRDVGHRLEEAVDLGVFTIIARPLLWALLRLHSVTGNYGWAIIILTIAIRLAFYPINQKQAAAMKAMQRIQPELKKIQEKYKDDREKLNQEMMETYRRHKVNPLAGCLPMLLQLPVFIGLYNVLYQAIELRQAPFIGWITDLSQPDRLGGLAIPFVSPPGIPVMTLLMGASMLIQQRMMPAGGDPMQQRMMMFMPVIFTVMFINFPAGLVLYWLANNILAVGQQYMTNRSST